MFRIIYWPSTSVAAPMEVPSITMFAPIKGSPVERSRTVPEILPVVPAFNMDPKIQTQRKMNRILTRREIWILSKNNFTPIF